MSSRALRRLLWLAALVALPVPLVGVGVALVPPLSALELGALSLAFTVVEHAHGIGGLVAGLFLAQALSWAVALWLAAALLARALALLPPFVRTRAAMFLVVLGLSLGVMQPIYRTPYSSRAAHSTLLGVYW